mmetsp:Transcript_31457/g.64968  ORF Transcript_31457/g.64968 Transcript_31457/m.64968 type:complete len:230 (-) Transcript_31457:141-830(-)
MARVIAPAPIFAHQGLLTRHLPPACFRALACAVCPVMHPLPSNTFCIFVSGLILQVGVLFTKELLRIPHGHYTLGARARIRGVRRGHVACSSGAAAYNHGHSGPRADSGTHGGVAGMHAGAHAGAHARTHAGPHAGTHARAHARPHSRETSRPHGCLTKARRHTELSWASHLAGWAEARGSKSSAQRAKWITWVAAPRLRHRHFIAGACRRLASQECCVRFCRMSCLLM